MIIDSPEITGSITISGSLIVQGTSTLTASMAISASYALTASYALNGGGTTIDTGSFVTTPSFNSFTSSINNKTGSFLTTGSSGTSQTINGSLTINQNLTVLGSSSILYVTSSQLNIGTNIITVNANTPEVRYGGLAVIDSGSSPQRSGSILFDSTNNQWIFVHQNAGGAVTSSVFIQGPQTFNNVGNETTLTTNKIPKATGGDLGEHIGDSNITDTGTLVSINSNTQVTGSLTISGSGATIQLTDKITIGSVGGDEGGEILLGKPLTNSSLTGSGITIDSYQNRLRFFEQGGNARGGYLDIASLGNGVATDLRLDTQLESLQAMGSSFKGYNIGCPLIWLATSGIGQSGGSGGVTNYTAIYIHSTTTITGVKWIQQTQGNYTSGSYNGVGLYSTSGATLTLVASSSNDGNIWKGTGNTIQSKSFVSTYTANAGIYYIGALYTQATQATAPAIAFAGSAAVGLANWANLDFTNSNKVNGTAGSGLTALATSVAANGIANVQHRYAFYLF